LPLDALRSPLNASLAACWSLPVVPIAILIFVFVASATGQESPPAHPSHDCGDANNLCITKKEVESVETSRKGRFGRAWQYQYQLSEQPAFAAVAVRGATEIIANPEKYLNQHTLTFQFSELFPATSNLPAIVAALYTAKSAANPGTKLIRLDPEICPSQHLIECLVAGGNLWQRFLSGATVSFAMSERDQLQQGALLTNFPTSQHYGPSGEVDFDPTSMFLTGSGWQTAVAALKDAKINPSNLDAEESRCFVAKKPPLPSETDDATQTECINAFSKPRLRGDAEAGTFTRIAATLIPKFQFKAVSQFDFIKNGGIFVAEPGLQRSLKSYTFAWDFRRLIASTADRAAALKAYGTLSTTRSGKLAHSKVCVTISPVSRGYMEVDDDFSADDCRTLTKSAKAETFALACATGNKIDIGEATDPGGSLNLPTGNQCNWR
jgi:hypothetical protein